jgi:threonine/homoserine/homoserine lactone efflux protein
MDLVQILAFTMVALLLVISPGPNGLLITKTVPISGKVAGFGNVAGFIVAFYLHGALSILGVSVILTKSSEAFFIVKMLGAIYLCWLGLKCLIDAFYYKKKSATLETSSKPKQSFLAAGLEGFLNNALNPKVSMFYLAAFPQFIPLGESAIFYGFILVSIHAFMNALWFSAMVLILSRIRAIASKEIYQKLLKGITGIIFLIFGGKLITLKPEHS